jgi:kynurenine formamidase
VKLAEQDVLALFDRCSNAGRWGEDDERGTLNFVCPEVTREACRTVSFGIPVSLAHDLCTTRSRQTPPSATRVTLVAPPGPPSAHELLTLVPHGWEMTHLDSLAHSSFDGRIWGGRPFDEAVTSAGATFASIAESAEGIVTRGVLLDVARARDVPFLQTGEGINAEDLDAAEELTGTRVRRGDAVLVRSGQDARRRAQDNWEEFPREGLLPDCIPWLHAREIALYGGDCIERLPSGYARVPLPLHQVGMVAMGLAILDAVEMERLAAAVAAFGRPTFLFVLAPLRVPGGSASAINPLAVF